MGKKRETETSLRSSVLRHKKFQFLVLGLSIVQQYLPRQDESHSRHLVRYSILLSRCVEENCPLPVAERETVTDFITSSNVRLIAGVRPSSIGARCENLNESIDRTLPAAAQYDAIVVSSPAVHLGKRSGNPYVLSS
jgi:hypothetical protein